MSMTVQEALMVQSRYRLARQRAAVADMACRVSEQQYRVAREAIGWMWRWTGGNYREQLLQQWRDATSAAELRMDLADDLAEQAEAAEIVLAFATAERRGAAPVNAPPAEQRPPAPPEPAQSARQLRADLMDLLQPTEGRATDSERVALIAAYARIRAGHAAPDAVDRPAFPPAARLAAPDIIRSELGTLLTDVPDGPVRVALIAAYARIRAAGG